MRLPPGVDRLGGLTITEEGRIISGQETPQGLPGGPWYGYDVLCQLKAADGNEMIQGWRAHGIRERIETFTGATLRHVIQDAGVDMFKLVFVHFDFSQ